MRKTLRATFVFALMFGAAFLSYLFISPQASAWYNSIGKPDFAPPVSLFVPIWLVLYLLMGIAFARILERPTEMKFRRWCFTFGAQVVLSILWAILFFDFHAVFFAMIISIILWFIVVILTSTSSEMDMPAFWFLVPYLAWTTFTMILTMAIWWIN